MLLMSVTNSERNLSQLPAVFERRIRLPVKSSSLKLIASHFSSEKAFVLTDSCEKDKLSVPRNPPNSFKEASIRNTENDRSSRAPIAEHSPSIYSRVNQLSLPPSIPKSAERTAARAERIGDFAETNAPAYLAPA